MSNTAMDSDGEATAQADEITFPAGTLVKVNAIPFELKEDTVLLGCKENVPLALGSCTPSGEAVGVAADASGSPCP